MSDWFPPSVPAPAPAETPAPAPAKSEIERRVEAIEAALRRHGIDVRSEP